jgi:GTP-binding protein
MPEPSPLPLVAIVGRPNVGKSTLFNRLVGERRAVVSQARGTTRDRLYAQVSWRGRTFRVVDTGGFEAADTPDHLSRQVQRQLRQAVQEADYVLLLCDAQQGPVPADAVMVQALRKTGKPMALVANKADHRLEAPSDCFALGVREVLAVSALHGRGVGGLLDHVIDRLLAVPPPPAERAVSLAILGRPNVGKSSLLNVILREERVIVSPQPGTTRDAIDTRLLVDGEPLVLIDTAGIKHKRKIRDPVEVFAMSRSLQAMERSDAVLYVLDGIQGVVNDDRSLLERVVASGPGLLLLVNKWDAAKRVPAKALTQSVHAQLPAVRFAPVYPVSAVTGSGVLDAVRAARQIVRAMQQPLAEEEVSAMIHTLWKANPPPRVRGRVLRYGGAQWRSGRPVRIHVNISPGNVLPRGYADYLLNRLAQQRRLRGIPLKVAVNARAFRP